MSKTMRPHHGGVIWIPRPSRPPAPHRQQRAGECLVAWEICGWISESWAYRAKGAGVHREPIHMLAALTDWYCSLRLPRAEADIFDDPPVLACDHARSVQDAR